MAAFLDTTIALIAGADAVLVVLTDEDSPNTLVETGVALGHGRPVLLIAEDAAISDGLVPDRLLIGLPRVRADARRHRGIAPSCRRLSRRGAERPVPVPPPNR
jgi:nucleoside 2-deoxyribosyltransferase